MSLFLCPLCGKQSSIRLYDPTKFDADIYAIQKVGLGRGKGFKITDRFSILNKGDPTVELIKDRILLLSKTLIDNECLNSEEVLSVLQIQTVNPGALAKNDSVIEDLSEEVIILKSRVNERNRRLQKKDSIIEDLSDKNVNLNRKVSSYSSKLKNKDNLIEDLIDSNVNLKSEVSSLEEDLEYRIGQAKELLRIARNQKSKIESLEEQVSDLSEELI